MQWLCVAGNNVQEIPAQIVSGRLWLVPSGDKAKRQGLPLSKIRPSFTQWFYLFLFALWLLFDYYFPKTGKAVGFQAHQGLSRFLQMGANFVGCTRNSRAHQTGRWKRYWGRNLCVFNPSKARRLENLRAFLSLSPQSSLRQVSNLRLVLVEYVFAKPGSLKQNLGFFNTETTGWQIEAKLVPFIDCISITVFKEGLTNYRLFPIMIPASEVKPWAIQLWWLMTSRWF